MFFEFRVSSLEFRVSSFEYRVSSFEYRVSSIEFRVSSHSKNFSRISNSDFEKMIRQDNSNKQTLHVVNYKARLSSFTHVFSYSRSNCWSGIKVLNHNHITFKAKNYIHCV